MLRHYTTTEGTRTTVSLDGEWWRAIDGLANRQRRTWTEWVRDTAETKPPGRTLAAWDQGVGVEGGRA